MITDETMITMVAALSTTLIIMLLAIRNTIHKKRLRRSLDWLETAKHLKYDTVHLQDLKNNIDPAYINTSNSSISTFKLSLKLSFGIAVLLGFSWWTFQLFTKDILIWAAVSGLFAVIGLILPFLIWREVKQREEIKDRAGRIIKQFEKESNEPKTQATEQRRSESIRTRESTSKTDTIKNIATSPRSGLKVAVPEDSVLRRHLLTQLRTEIESSLFPRPTDCVLQRHYEQLIELKLENRLLNPEILNRFKFIDGIETPANTTSISITQAKENTGSIEQEVSLPSKPASKHQVPEDCVMRRHLLTQLRQEIESEWFTRPTDCVLQRHYDQLIEAELENRLANPEDLSAFTIIDGHEPDPNFSSRSKPGIIDSAMNKSVSPSTMGPESEPIQIPEDSILRRHFLSLLQNEIETAMYPRPTEVTLQRHYNQLLEAELASHLKWNTNWIR